MLCVHSLPIQNEYCECVDLILSHFPDQIDHLLALVFSEKIAEAKMQQLLNYLSKNSTQLLSRILSKLASNTCLAGMELLRYILYSNTRTIHVLSPRRINSYCKHFVYFYYKVLIVINVP